VFKANTGVDEFMQILKSRSPKKESPTKGQAMENGQPEGAVVKAK